MERSRSATPLRCRPCRRTPAPPWGAPHPPDLLPQQSGRGTLTLLLASLAATALCVTLAPTQKLTLTAPAPPAFPSTSHPVTGQQSDGSSTPHLIPPADAGSDDGDTCFDRLAHLITTSALVFLGLLIAADFWGLDRSGPPQARDLARGQAYAYFEPVELEPLVLGEIGEGVGVM